MPLSPDDQRIQLNDQADGIRFAIGGGNRAKVRTWWAANHERLPDIPFSLRATQRYSKHAWRKLFILVLTDTYYPDESRRDEIAAYLRSPVVRMCVREYERDVAAVTRGLLAGAVFPAHVNIGDAVDVASKFLAQHSPARA